MSTGNEVLVSQDKPGSDINFKDAAKAIKSAGNYTIEVLAGAHSGSNLEMPSGTITIGSGKDNDIVLFGSNIETKHIEVELPKAAFKPLRVTPLQGPVTLEDGSTLQVGQMAEIETDDSLTFGDTTIQLSRVADPKKLVKPGLRIIAIICLILMFILLYNIISSFAYGAAGFGQKTIAYISENISDGAKAITGQDSTKEGSEHDEAFNWSVRSKLEDLKLNHKVRSNVTSDGSIRLSGNISDKELPRWTAFLQWYDTTENFPPLIRDISRADIDSNLPQIKSVWLDDKPTAFFKDGTVAHIGSQVRDGWKVVNITNVSVMIERDGAVVALTY